MKGRPNCGGAEIGHGCVGRTHQSYRLFLFSSDKGKECGMETFIVVYLSGSY